MDGDAFVCNVVKEADEAMELIELGFEYVRKINGLHLYRKRK